MTQEPLPKKITLGISHCLLGGKVRFDGSHKRNKFIIDVLGKYFDFLPICPEVAVGLGVPRPSVRLIGDINIPIAIIPKKDNLDITIELQTFSREKVANLRGISGYILKKDSPTCGMARVKVYQDNNYAIRKGIGIFAKELMHAYPQLPVEEEGRLGDARLRENFIERVFMYRQWQELIRKQPKAKDVIEFHATHKLSLMAHSIKDYQALGQMVAKITEYESIDVFLNEYILKLMQAFKIVATQKKHTNVLTHCYGYLKKRLPQQDRVELLTAIEDYRHGIVPLIVPITLLKHYFQRNHDSYMAKQTYLMPYPADLKLRNSI